MYIGNDTYIDGIGTFSDNVVTSKQLISNILDGVAPLSVTSKTLVNNLNVELLGGYPSSYYLYGANITRAAEFDTISNIDAWHDAVLADGGIVENIGLLEELYISDDKFGVSAYNNKYFTVNNGIVDLVDNLSIFGSFSSSILNPRNIDVGYIPYKNNISLINSPIYTDGNSVFIGYISDPTSLNKFAVLGNTYIDGNITSTKQFVSTIADGTAPIVVSSTTLNSNLNADLLDGHHASYFQIAGTYDNYANWKLQVDSLAVNDVTSGELIKFISGTNVSLDYSSGIITINSSYTESDPVFLASTVANISDGIGFLKNDGSGVWSYDSNIYELAFTKNTAFNKNFGVLTTQVWGYDAHPTTTTDYGLPDYPTTLPASDVYAWAKASVKPSYTTAEITEDTNLYYTDARVAAKVTKSFIDALGVDAATLGGSLPSAFQPAGSYDNYQYWTISDGTSNDNILSSNTLKFVGTNLAKVSYDSITKTVTIDSQSTNINRASEFDTIATIDTWHQSVLDDGGIVENIGLLEELYISDTAFGISTFNNKYFTVNNGVVDLNDNIDFFGNITAANLNIDNWNTAYSWGNWNTNNLTDGRVVYKSTSGLTDTTLIFNSTDLSPLVNNSFSLGIDPFRWSNIYSVKGSFSGNVSVGTITPSNLTNGKLPYYNNTSLVDSPILTDGTYISIGGSVSTSYILSLYGNTVIKTSVGDGVALFQGETSHLIKLGDYEAINGGTNIIIDDSAANISLTSTSTIIKNTTYDATTPAILNLGDINAYIKAEFSAGLRFGVYGNTDILKLNEDGTTNINAKVNVGAHGTASDAEVINTIYGTDATPPTGTYPEGTIYIQYQA